jgi:hypothetical protein
LGSIAVKNTNVPFESGVASNGSEKPPLAPGEMLPWSVPLAQGLVVVVVVLVVPVLLLELLLVLLLLLVEPPVPPVPPPVPPDPPDPPPPHPGLAAPASAVAVTSASGPARCQKRPILLSIMLPPFARTSLGPR